MSNNLTTEIKGYLSNKQIENKLINLFRDDKNKIERFKSSLINISLDYSLSKCSADSILRSALSLAEVGLDINKVLGQAYILKYKSDAEPVISYKGWQTIVERTGKFVKAFSVFKCDVFEMDLSDFDEKITFIPDFNQRNSSDDEWYKKNLKGILVKIKSKNNVKNVFVPIDKIEKIKGKSQSLKGDKWQYSPYNNWAEEMYLAKAIKYTLSREALNFKEEEIARAIEVDNKLDKQISEDIIADKNTKNDNYIEGIIENEKDAVEYDVICEASKEDEYE